MMKTIIEPLDGEFDIDDGICAIRLK